MLAINTGRKIFLKVYIYIYIMSQDQHIKSVSPEIGYFPEFLLDL